MSSLSSRPNVITLYNLRISEELAAKYMNILLNAPIMTLRLLNFHLNACAFGIIVLATVHCALLIKRTTTSKLYVYFIASRLILFVFVLDCSCDFGPIGDN